MNKKYAEIAKNGASPVELASAFIQDFFGTSKPNVPINPFQILRDMGVPFSFRNFEGYEGVYIPSESIDDIPIVGINASRRITRQRYTAAHELCHHLKDADQGFICSTVPQNDIERYAENFAAELLMPRSILLEQVALYQCNGKVDLKDALYIADYFGVSFAACVYQLAYALHVLEGETSSLALKQRMSDFGPTAKRAEFGMTDLELYRQLYNAGNSFFVVDPTEHTRQIFETEYVFQDSRLEGLSIDKERAAEIVVDLRLHGLKNLSCREENQNFIEVAGLASVYDWVFGQVENEADSSIYDIKEINKKLFSFAPYSEFGGEFRTNNAVITGSSIEVTDYNKISQQLFILGKKYDALLAQMHQLPISEYIEQLLDLHHELTAVHPFNDGNGRTLRAFVNYGLLMRGLPPVLFPEELKTDYKDALSQADKTGKRIDLYQLYYREMLKVYAVFTDYLI